MEIETIKISKGDVAYICSTMCERILSTRPACSELCPLHEISLEIFGKGDDKGD